MVQATAAGGGLRTASQCGQGYCRAAVGAAAMVLEGREAKGWRPHHRQTRDEVMPNRRQYVPSSGRVPVRLRENKDPSARDHVAIVRRGAGVFPHSAVRASAASSSQRVYRWRCTARTTSVSQIAGASGSASRAVTVSSTTWFRGGKATWERKNWRTMVQPRRAMARKAAQSCSSKSSSVARGPASGARRRLCESTRAAVRTLIQTAEKCPPVDQHAAKSRQGFKEFLLVCVRKLLVQMPGEQARRTTTRADRKRADRCLELSSGETKRTSYAVAIEGDRVSLRM